MKQEQGANFFTRISVFIVDKRMLFFFVFIGVSIFSLFSMGWTKVEDDITQYLDEETETRKGLDVMEREFVTFSSAEVMLSNIPYERAEEVADQIKAINGVSGVEFEDTDEYYWDASALLNITFDGVDTDELVLGAMEKIREITETYDTSIKTTVGVSMADSLANEMVIIFAIALVIIISVLLFTSKAYAEILILLITFGVAGLLNMGTNYWFGEISFISDSVAVILQLALAIDYALILCHRFSEERETKEPREACIEALSKSIPEVSSSSLTTICGLLALSFMNYGIGADLSKVLIKAILCSLVCVFCLMPGLLLLMTKWIDKTKHKNFVPSIAGFGRKTIRYKHIILPIFTIIAIGSIFLQSHTEYLFGVSEARAARRSDIQIQEDRIKEKFRAPNLLAVVVPSGDYEKEALLIEELEEFQEVDSVLGLANTDALDGYTLTEELNAREFSELLDIDYEVAKMLYATYAIDDENYAKLVNNTENYSLPLLDLILFLDNMVKEEYVTLDETLSQDLEDQSEQIRDGQLQLESENYTRMLVFLDLPEEGETTFSFLEKSRKVANKYYEEVYLVGNPTSNRDLSAVFSRDNVVISVLSALFVVIVLLFTFKNVAAPIYLIIVIQSAIFINFSFPFIQDKPLFFIGYLVVSAIQMGANVDYAIVITNRYMNLKEKMKTKEAVIQALDESFVTVLTSGTILASSGIAIQFVTTDGTIAIIGECLGRGTIISMILVLGVLPSLLYIGTKMIDKTSFDVSNLRKNVLGETSLFANVAITQEIKAEETAAVEEIHVGAMEEDKHEEE